MEIQLAARCPCVVESNFRAEFDTARFLALGERHPFASLQINCFADGAVLAQRFRERSASGQRHPGHRDHLNREEFQATLLRDRLEPLAIGGPVIGMDTTDLDALGYDAIYDTIHRSFLGQERPGAA